MEATVVPAAPAAPPASRTPPPATTPDTPSGTSRSKAAGSVSAPGLEPISFGPLFGAALASAAGEPASFAPLGIGDLLTTLPMPPDAESESAFPEEADGDRAGIWAGPVEWIVPATATPARPEAKQATPAAFPGPGTDRAPPAAPSPWPAPHRGTSASGPGGQDPSFEGAGRPVPPVRQGPGWARGLPESLRESVLQEPGERGRAERLWGFWLRREAEAAAGPGRQGPEAASDDALAVTGPRAPGRELPEGADGLAKTARPGETPAPEAPRGAAAAPPEGAREASGPRPQPAPPPPHQVAHAVRMAVSRGGDRVTVRLEPEHLGKVEVVLAREPAGAGLTAHLRVENPQAHQALSTEMPLLRQALETRGVNLVHVQVDLDDRQAGGERAGKGPAHRSRRGGGPQAAAGEGEDLAVRAHLWRPWGFEALI
ncbi:MAG: flagellar hook-length control protein FliK [Thermodesulfobacteriota bacterium]